MQNAFGDDTQGRPYGGGRAARGGFRVPLGLIAETEDEETLWALVKNVVRQRVARVVPELEKAEKRNKGD
jgi:nanoRNase/pAp phosphatase (c-di-AMP/oligoRNAs hydrolase)